MLRCWNQEPTERPDFVELKHEITQILEFYKQQHPNQLEHEYEIPS